MGAASVLIRTVLAESSGRAKYFRQTDGYLRSPLYDEDLQVRMTTSSGVFTYRATKIDALL